MFLVSHFMQLLIAHGFSIQGFNIGCRLVLVIDSYHLSSLYKRVFLFVIAYDADNGMFPLSLGMVNLKNYEE